MQNINRIFAHMLSVKLDTSSIADYIKVKH